jgi:hypothetical protein
LTNSSLAGKTVASVYSPVRRWNEGTWCGRWLR